MTATPRIDRDRQHARTERGAIASFDLADARLAQATDGGAGMVAVQDAPVPRTEQQRATGAPEARLVSVDTAAQLLGVGRTTIYDLLNRGAFRSMKIGRRTLLPVEDIDAFVERKLASA